MASPPTHVALRAAWLSCLLAGALAHGASQSDPAVAAVPPVGTEAPSAVRPPPTLTPGIGAAQATSRAADLIARGYTEQEWWLGGTAQVHDRAGSRSEDGRWAARPRAGSARPYQTRLLVRRPADPTRFNGIVLVEWLNSTLKFDLDGGWILLRDEILREGYAWVGVSVQAEALPGLLALGPHRYDVLRLPGDAYAWDIYGDALQTVRQHAQRLLGIPAPPRLRLLGVGYSQSAVFLTTWLNTFEPVLRRLDGALLHGAAPVAAPLNGDEGHAFSPRLRADLNRPVMQVQTEMEVSVSWPLSKTPDTASVRYWEVAGAAHLDADVQAETRAVAPRDWLDSEPVCLKPLNALPLRHADAAALHALRRWVVDGVPPPTVPRMGRGPLGFLAHDDDGNVLGGLRLPEIDAPLARFGTYGNISRGWPSVRGLYTCIAGGSTVPLSAERLQRRYGDRASWLRAVQTSADRLLQSGLLRPADHALTLETARRTPWPASR